MSLAKHGRVLFAGGLVLALLVGFAIARSTQDAGTATVPAAGSVTAIPLHSHGNMVAGDVGGMAISAGGFTLAPTTTTFTAGVVQPFSFQVLGPDRRPVTDYVLNMDKKLHLVIARRDLSGFQHLHPDLGADGTWTVPLTLPAPGTWRAYADFVTTDATGQQVPTTLAVDLTVAGDYRPVALPGPDRVVTADAYTVSYEGTPQVGSTQPFTFRVFANGTPVTDLQRYLGAYGHLVVLREGDQAYLHIHPEDELVGGAVKFWLAVPSVGRYRLFFQFQTDGTVHRAEFTMLA